MGRDGYRDQIVTISVQTLILFTVFRHWRTKVMMFIALSSNSNYYGM